MMMMMMMMMMTKLRNIQNKRVQECANNLNVIVKYY